MCCVTEKLCSVKKRERGFLVLHFPLRKENASQSKEIKPDMSVVPHQSDLKSKKKPQRFSSVASGLPAFFPSSENTLDLCHYC